ncbi:hypothetical protein NYE54_16945 [Paenibacillus sp. FSL K6-1330]|uniref:hypothetical protein n=1 Tax=Paenibacillus sp. FSL K6-1330 TaxID=2975292 RepID=UPI0030DABF77
MSNKVALITVSFNYRNKWASPQFSIIVCCHDFYEMIIESGQGCLYRLRLFVVAIEENQIDEISKHIDPVFYVEGQEHGPIESRYFSGFFILSVQVLVPNQGQELVPIAVKDKYIVRLPIR